MSSTERQQLAEGHTAHLEVNYGSRPYGRGGRCSIWHCRCSCGLRGSNGSKREARAAMRAHARDLNKKPRCAKHVWEETQFRVAPGTCGNSGRGRAVAHARTCRLCGRHEVRKRWMKGVRHVSRWVKGNQENGT